MIPDSERSCFYRRSLRTFRADRMSNDTRRQSAFRRLCTLRSFRLLDLYELFRPLRVRAHRPVTAVRFTTSPPVRFRRHKDPSPVSMDRVRESIQECIDVVHVPRGLCGNILRVMARGSVYQVVERHQIRKPAVEHQRSESVRRELVGVIRDPTILITVHVGFGRALAASLRVTDNESSWKRSFEEWEFFRISNDCLDNILLAGKIESHARGSI